MAYRISKLYVGGNNIEGYSFSAQASTVRLENLSKVNLFVGPNNSGKSRFLRSLVRIPKIVFTNDADAFAIEQAKNSMIANLESLFGQFRINDANNFLKDLRSMDMLDRFEEGERYAAPFMDIVAKAEHISHNNVLMNADGYHPNTGVLSQRIRDIAGPVKQQVSGILDKRTNFDRVYIPTLRGLRTWENERQLLEKRIILDYFPDGKVSVFTGETLYRDFQSLLLGSLSGREIVKDFQDFLSDAFFSGQSVVIIPRLDDPHIFVKIGEEEEQPIHKLGDGVVAIIILTFPLFKAKGKNLLCFIEEPELFMHPGLQRLFLDVITRHKGFENFQYFFTTHSNHFLDLTADISQVSIYTFNKTVSASTERETKPNFDVVNVSNEDSKSLELLGVKNSSVFLTNCTIWVEGITDRRYFSHFLNLYQDFLNPSPEEGVVHKLFKEDLHYSFVEYGGGNITHWSFLDNIPDPIQVERLCGRLFLISDKDGERNLAKVKRQEALKKTLKNRYYCLSCREVENLLTPEIIFGVVEDYEGSRDNFTAISQSKYKDAYLGKYIETTLLSGRKDRKGNYAAKSGTLTDKVGFCQRAISQMKNFESLSPEAKLITKRIYDHIKSLNT